MERIGSVLWPLVILALTGASHLGCSAGLNLITPEQAQDKVYDHRSRAEAFRLSHSPKLASIERQKAREYKRLIEEGRTTTPRQALAAAMEHRRRAEACQRAGYTRFVRAELEKAALFEDFAIRNGALTATGASARAQELLAKAQAYERVGLDDFAEHYKGQAGRVEQINQLQQSALKAKQ